MTILLIPYEEGTFYWTVFATIGVFTTLGLTVWGLLQERKKRIHGEDVLARPLERPRYWIRRVEEGEITPAEVQTGNPNCENGKTLTLNTGEHWVWIQAFTRTGIHIDGIDLRFLGEGYRPKVMTLQDCNRPDINTLTPPNQEEGRKLWYVTPLPVGKEQAVSYMAKVHSTDEYTGDLGLQFQLTTGHTPILSVPCQIRDGAATRGARA